MTEIWHDPNTRPLLEGMVARLARGVEYTLEDAHQFLGLLAKEVDSNCFTTGPEKWLGIRDCMQRLEVLRARACNALSLYNNGSTLYHIVHVDRKMHRLAQRILALADQYGIENASFYAWSILPPSDFLLEHLGEETLDPTDTEDLLLMDAALLNQFLYWVDEYRELWVYVVQQLQETLGSEAATFGIEVHMTR